MGDAELAYLSLEEVATHLRARDLSPVEVTRTLIERTERLEPALGAYITFTPEAALADARRAEQQILAGEYRGPLHGVPVAIKDHLWSKGVPSTFGSRAFATVVPEEDATAVARLRQAGAILLGTTNLPELCWSESFRDHAYAIPRNPCSALASRAPTSGRSCRPISAAWPMRRLPCGAASAGRCAP